MIGLLVTFVIGLAIAFISKSNTSGISISLGDGQYFTIPLYMMTVGTYILGILIAWIIEIPEEIMTAFQIKGLGHKVKSGKSTIIQLQNKIHTLEIENSKLNGRYYGNTKIQSNETMRPNRVYDFFNKIIHRPITNDN